jgi:hypothetical protein
MKTGITGLCVLLLSSCCSNSSVSVGAIKFYDPNLVTTVQNHYLTAIEIPAERTKSLGMEGTGFGYSKNCFVQAEKPDLVTVQFGDGGLRIDTLSPGETRIDVQCSGDDAGEYAPCSAPYRSSGSITVRVVQAVKRSSI